MAKKKTTKKAKSFEESLWDSANKLRGSVESAEYKHVVLSLIFLKFISDVFETQKAKIINNYGQQYVDMEEFYHRDNTFYLPKNSRWNYILDNAKQNDIAIKIDTALHDIEKKNKSLTGALPENYFSRIDLEVSKLSALLDEINNIQTIKSQHEDIVGRVYEYFLSKFAIAEGRGKGEFYTPKSIVNLIAEMIEPFKGRVYDPCCGSGGMFVQSMKFIENHKGNKKDIAIYGQELTTTTYKLAKMNLAIRGISADLGETARDTFFKDQHKDEKFDFIMANPPFNQRAWRADDELLDDDRWNGYDTPPTSNANYGWILHIASKLSQNGVAGFILGNGALTGTGKEFNIRKKLVDNDLVEAIAVLPMNMFYTTDVSVTLWILNRNKKEKKVKQASNSVVHRNREKEVLFMDLRNLGVPFEKKFLQFSVDETSLITNTFHAWRAKEKQQNYKDIPEFCRAVKYEELVNKGYSLAPSSYIEFIDRDLQVDFDKNIKKIKDELEVLLSDEKKSNVNLFKVFKDFGHEFDL